MRLSTFTSAIARRLGLKLAPPVRMSVRACHANRAVLSLLALEDRTVPTIGGYAYYDMNHNGSQDSGEFVAQGVAVTLTGGSLMSP